MAEIDDWITPPESTGPPADDWVTPPSDMSAAEKAWRGVLNVPSLGIVPAVEGLGAAAGPEWHQSQAAHDFAPIIGAAKLLHSYISGHPDDQVRKDYEAGRADALAQEKEAGKSWWYTAGQGLGALVPLGAATRSAGLGARMLKGALGGSIGSGLYAGGTAISEGAPAADVATQAGISALVGGALAGAAPGAGALVRPALSTVEHFAGKFSPIAAATLATDRLVSGDFHGALLALGGGAAGWSTGKAAAGLRALMDMLASPGPQRVLQPAQRYVAAPVGSRAGIRNVAAGAAAPFSDQQQEQQQ